MYKKKKIAIIGGGVSGCFLSYLLDEKDQFEITIFEKSKGLGGRCSIRRTPKFGTFHHGAQFFTNKK